MKLPHGEGGEIVPAGVEAGKADEPLCPRGLHGLQCAVYLRFFPWPGIIQEEEVEVVLANTTQDRDKFCFDEILGPVRIGSTGAVTTTDRHNERPSTRDQPPKEPRALAYIYYCFGGYRRIAEGLRPTGLRVFGLG